MLPAAALWAAGIFRALVRGKLRRSVKHPANKGGSQSRFRPRRVPVGPAVSGTAALAFFLPNG